MENLSFFRSLLARDDTEGAVLCTIIAEEGSTPRDAGTFMAVFADGSTTGTVGGGAVERIAIRYAEELIKTGHSVNVVRNYDLQGNSSAAETGMICGGALSLLFRTLDRDALDVLSTLKDVQEGTRELYLMLPLPEADKSPEAEAQLPALCFCGKYALPETVRDKKGTVPVLDEKMFYSPIVTYGIVYLFGLGHVGRALYPVLRSVNFPVVVIDDREEMLTDERYDDAIRKICMPYRSFTEKLPLTGDDYVVVCTAGHHGDYDVLLQTLPAKPAYVGCIGSKVKAETVRKRLIEAGIDRTLAGQIYSPIGLKIRAKTPEEIAVSIAAEMILARAEHTEG